MVFPNGGPIPRHPSQLYEAALEGVVLFIVLGVLVRSGALKRPGVVTGAFALGYGVARIICELFREPDAQLGFLWGGLTMGMLLCVPLMLAGVAVLDRRLDARTASAQRDHERWLTTLRRWRAKSAGSSASPDRCRLPNTCGSA